MKIYIEREVLLMNGNVKTLKAEIEIDFNVDEKDFIDADIQQDFFNIPIPCKSNDLRNFIDKYKLVDAKFMNSCRIYSETYSNDYVFIFQDNTVKSEFFIKQKDGKKVPFVTKCYWHKISNNGIEIIVNEKGKVLE